jgi:hypothetical protein
MDGPARAGSIPPMSPLRPLLAALILLEVGCAGSRVTARGNPLPPPAQGRAGTRGPGAGPAPGSRAAAGRERTPARDAAVRRAVATAAGLVGRREIVVGAVRYGPGCGALVDAAYRAAGHRLASPSPGALYEDARRRRLARKGRPAVGDLAFLAERPGGAVAHVGLVESVGADGTVLVLHRTGRGVARLRVNLLSPGSLRDPAGRARNDVLVSGGERTPAGRLLVGFATVL